MFQTPIWRKNANPSIIKRSNRGKNLENIGCGCLGSISLLIAAIGLFAGISELYPIAGVAFGVAAFSSWLAQKVKVSSDKLAREQLASPDSELRKLDQEACRVANAIVTHPEGISDPLIMKSVAQAIDEVHELLERGTDLEATISGGMKLFQVPGSTEEIEWEQISIAMAKAIVRLTELHMAITGYEWSPILDDQKASD